MLLPSGGEAENRASDHLLQVCELVLGRFVKEEPKGQSWGAMAATAAWEKQELTRFFRAFHKYGTAFDKVRRVG